MLNVVGVAFQGIVLSWIRKLESACGCSDRWQRTYMKFYALSAIILMFLLATGLTLKSKALMGALFGAGLVNMYAILTFIPTLKYNGCTCAYTGDHGPDFRQDFIYWWTLIGTLALLFFAMSALFKM